jgi:hypothetical protein
MDSVRDIHCWMGCPIRRSRDQRALASTPGFSQRATSFIASRCQGIHQMPLPQRLIAKTRRLQRQALLTTSPHVKTLIRRSQKPERRSQKPAPAFDIHTSSAFTESHPNHRHHADSRKRPRLTPSSLCQRSQGRKGPRPPAQTRHSRSMSAPAAAPAALAVQAHRCRGSRRTINRSRGGGGDRNRTDDLLLAKQALSQLSYTPTVLGEAQNPSRRQRRPCAAKAHGFGRSPKSVTASAAPLRRESRSRRK